ncbi:MAG TPA: sn-glycerol-3-phosphate ABC transporter ATP-binding protein UgpC [Blastocatellia bacterium]|nr:sn-glycerol-3-phosphate ABC transporter ATP-binding protein UgpC [Blastocatellia bacterium]
MATLTLRSISKSFGDLEVIKGIDLEIEDRSFVVFVGPSGCGKSTLLRLIAGLEEITSGDLLIDGEKVNDVPPDKRGLAMVFQSYALYPHMTVAENMSFSLRLAGVQSAERKKKVVEAARILQLESLLERKPRELSGGQRQRVAIGRAIVRNPKVFLFDEPLSNLDAGLRVQMRIEIARLHESLNTTMIYVTHDQVEAMTLADKIVVLRDGRIEQVGTPLELYRRPKNLFVAGFIGSPGMNLLSARVVALTESGATIALPGAGELEVPLSARKLSERKSSSNNLKPGETITLGVRPEHLHLSQQGQFQGEVIVAERLGSETYLYVQMDGGNRVTIETRGDSPAKVHDRVAVQIAGGDCHLFDPSGEAL